MMREWSVPENVDSKENNPQMNKQVVQNEIWTKNGMKTGRQTTFTMMSRFLTKTILNEPSGRDKTTAILGSMSVWVIDEVPNVSVSSAVICDESSTIFWVYEHMHDRVYFNYCDLSYTYWKSEVSATGFNQYLKLVVTQLLKAECRCLQLLRSSKCRSAVTVLIVVSPAIEKLDISQ